MKWSRKINKVIILGITLLFTYGCNDEIIPSKNQVYKGRIMYSCDVPAANLTVNFVSWGAWQYGAWSMAVTTDEDGYFKFINKHRGGPDVITKVGIENLPNEDTNDLGTMYMNPKISFIRKLKVENPYTKYDTLYLVNYDVLPTEGFSKEKRLSIAGPFHNAIIDTIWNRPLMNINLEFGEPVLYREKYLINEWDGTPIPFAVTKINNLCDGKLKDVVIEIK